MTEMRKERVEKEKETRKRKQRTERDKKLIKKQDTIVLQCHPTFRMVL